MAMRRLLLHEILCDLIPERWDEKRQKNVHDVYFQPPESIKMKYPAIVYGLNTIKNDHADNGVYISNVGYSVTVIDTDPDSPIIGKVASLPSCRFNRHYEKDNLYHDVFTIFF